MSTNTTRPTVSDIARDSGARAAELARFTPNVSRYTLQAIMLGRIPGVTQASKVAEGLRALAGRYKEDAGKYLKAASALDKHYPTDETVREVDPEMTERDAAIISLAATGQHNFAAIGRTVGRTRELVRQVVEAYEERTGEKLPRYGKT